MDDMLVHEGRPWTIIDYPWTTKPSYTKRTKAQHLELSTKPATISTNPSNKLTSVSGYSFIAVEEVNSGLVGFHKSWGGYWTNNRPRLPIYRTGLNPTEVRFSLRHISKTLGTSSSTSLTSPSEGVRPVFSGLLFDFVLFLVGLQPFS